MSTPWLVAFLSLWALVLFESVLLFGAFRRVSLVLETAEARLRALPLPGPGGLQAGAVVPPFVAWRPDGSTFSDDDLRGDRSLVLFLSSGCPPCRTLVADLNARADELNSRLFIVLHDESELSEVELERPDAIVYQRDGSMARAFETTATPHAFLVDGDGIIVGSSTSNSVAGLRRLIEYRVKGGDRATRSTRTDALSNTS